MKKLLCLGILILAAVCMLSACASDTTKSDLWENALYLENAEIGAGDKTIELEIITMDKTVALTVKTDKDNLEDALTEHSLISGEKGPYGMYVKLVNGIEADYDKDKTYWSLSKNGEYLTTGVSDTKIADEDKYEFTYIK